jgi:hypothetical protein
VSLSLQVLFSSLFLCFITFLYSPCICFSIEVGSPPASSSLVCHVWWEGREYLAECSERESLSFSPILKSCSFFNKHMSDVNVIRIAARREREREREKPEKIAKYSWFSCKRLEKHPFESTYLTWSCFKRWKRRKRCQEKKSPHFFSTNSFGIKLKIPLTLVDHAFSLIFDLRFESWFMTLLSRTDNTWDWIAIWVTE